MRYIISSFSFLLLMISLSAASPAQTLEPPKSSGTPLYIIQPNDLLQLFVWKEPTLSGSFLVRPDGRISLPLIQDLQAAGMNPGQLKQHIEESLKEYVDTPNVTVIVQTIQSYRVFVVGKVSRPGMLTMERPMSVLQALSLAGGLVDFANSADIVIIRNAGEDSTLFRFNYPEAIRGKNFSQNMLLKSGDVVVVP